MDHGIWHEVLYTAGTLALGFAGVGLKSLTSAWASKVRNQTLSQVIRNTDDVVMHVVKSVYQTHVKPRQEKRKRHFLSKREGINMRQLALQEVKEHLGPKVLKELQENLGPDIDRVLGHHLEAAIQDVKHERQRRPLLLEERRSENDGDPVFVVKKGELHPTLSCSNSSGGRIQTDRKTRAVR